MGKLDSRSIRVVAALGLAAGIILSSAGPAAAQTLMTESEARAALEEEYGVQVLRVEPGEQDGVPVFVVRVMNPGGNFNEAFQVNTLVINRQTGELVRQFRHGPSGMRGAGGARAGANENSGPILRRESVQ